MTTVRQLACTIDTEVDLLTNSPCPDSFEASTDPNNRSGIVLGKCLKRLEQLLKQPNAYQAVGYLGAETRNNLTDLLDGASGFESIFRALANR